MKLSAIILAATCLTSMVAAIPAIAAPVIATVYETYDIGVDDGYVSVTNNSAANFTDVFVNGSDLGPLAAGSSTLLSLGFGDPKGDVGFTVTISAAGQTISRDFTWSDYDNSGTTTRGPCQPIRLNRADVRSAPLASCAAAPGWPGYRRLPIGGGCRF